MALITCPECGKDVSDKAVECPHCKAILKEPDKKICVECGNELEEGTEICPKCGCPTAEHENDKLIDNVAGTKENLLNNKKKIKVAAWGIVVVILIIIIAIMGTRAKKASDAKKEEEEKARISEEYLINLYDATSKILSGATRAEKAGGLIHDVWYNTIFEKKDITTDAYTRSNGYFLNDFNDALSNLFGDSSFQVDISYITSNQLEVKEVMKALKNPPQEYEEAYDAIKDLYDAYLEFTNHVVDPKGNLQTFTSDFNDYDSKVVNCYNHMRIYLEE